MLLKESWRCLYELTKALHEYIYIRFLTLNWVSVGLLKRHQLDKNELDKSQPTCLEWSCAVPQENKPMCTFSVMA